MNPIEDDKLLKKELVYDVAYLHFLGNPTHLTVSFEKTRCVINCLDEVLYHLIRLQARLLANERRGETALDTVFPQLLLAFHVILHRLVPNKLVDSQFGKDVLLTLLKIHLLQVQIILELVDVSFDIIITSSIGNSCLE